MADNETMEQILNICKRYEDGEISELIACYELWNLLKNARIYTLNHNTKGD